jgi:hypothetical protein
LDQTDGCIIACFGISPFFFPDLYMQAGDAACIDDDYDFFILVNQYFI